MAVHMDNATEVSSTEHVRHLYNKNVELETKRRRSVQGRMPVDPNVWQQMRENFEAIILEDHTFAEKHEIEFALWQLHYGRIEELRSHYNAATASAKNSPGQGGKAGSSRPDRVAKMRSQFKTFLSEATGFYHDLMLKIRAKYGFPLAYLSDDPETEAALLSKDGNKSLELKKGLISCHRCLIYLGDLARYKVIYGEPDSKMRDFSAASSYYMQASSFWPSSGNPHHQLAILASYSSDEFVAIYRYFRSLGVENPFSMARDNLIIAFEKNRQSHLQLTEDARTSVTKTGGVRVSGKGRGKVDGRFSSKQRKAEVSPVKEKASDALDNFKVFSVKFVRLHGILFTRTSLETFADVLSMAKVDFLELLSSHSDEQPKFGDDPAESGLFIVRLVAILIFSVHNANKESEDQSYAEILQRSVLLQNAYIAAFEFMGHVFKRCVKLNDILSSSLLPGILVFTEWLACHPELVSLYEEEQAGVRSFFWNNCIAFLNHVLSTGLFADDEDDICFFNMSRYDESVTANRLALWEDFELRGFLPLHPAHQILDFSRKNFYGKDGGYKEKKARVERVVAAGKAFASVVRVGQQAVYFDPNLKKFTIGTEHQSSHDIAFSNHEMPIPKPDSQFFHGDDEEEEIVFQPPVADKHADDAVPMMNHGQVLGSVSKVDIHEMRTCAESLLASDDGNLASNGFVTTAPSSGLCSDAVAQHFPPVMPNTSQWLHKQQTSILNGLRNFSLMENGHSMNSKPDKHFGISEPIALLPTVPQPVKLNDSNTKPSIPSPFETELPSNIPLNFSSAYAYDVAPKKSMQVLPIGTKKNPVSRPVRHNGPPPGFTHFPSKPYDEPYHVFAAKDDIALIDDYRWLDGYEIPSAAALSRFQVPNLTGQAYNNCNTSKASSMAGMVTFPFPGKLASPFPATPDNLKGQADYQFPQPMKVIQEQQMQKVKQHSMLPPEQFRGQSLWEGRFLV